MSRRNFVSASAFAGVGALVSSGFATRAEAQSASPTPTTSTSLKADDMFFHDADLNYNFLTLLGFRVMGSWTSARRSRSPARSPTATLPASCAPSRAPETSSRPSRIALSAGAVPSSARSAYL